MVNLPLIDNQTSKESRQCLQIQLTLFIRDSRAPLANQRRVWVC